MQIMNNDIKDNSIKVIIKIIVDVCIAKEIQNLNNNHNIATKYSCCGHGDEGYIMVDTNDDIKNMLKLKYEITDKEHFEDIYDIEDNNKKIMLFKNTICTFKPKSKCKCGNKTEIKKEWEGGYNNIEEQLLNLENKSPENFIDDVKLKYLSKYLPMSGTILEVGAGSGRLITRIGIEHSDYKIIGLDYVKNSTKIIKNNIIKHNLNGTSVCADVFKLPFKNNSVDAIVSGGLLEHFNEGEIPFVVMEMKRVLKSGGLLYAEIVPKKFSLCRPIILKEAGGYENSFNKKKWKQILENNNLNNIKVVSGLVLPPNIYNWFKSGILLEITYKLKYFVEYMENTILSDIFGFSYYITARK